MDIQPSSEGEIEVSTASQTTRKLKANNSFGNDAMRRPITYTKFNIDSNNPYLFIHITQSFDPTKIIHNTVMSREKGEPIDTSYFMSKYFHPKNIATAAGDKSVRATISTSYSKSKGIYRQKQVDDEINRILSNKKPSSSKITIIIDDAQNLLKVFHHHHHCLDIQLTTSRNNSSSSGQQAVKGRVVWFWNDWETATDERVMKGAIAALDSSWNEQNVLNNGSTTTTTINRKSSKEKSSVGSSTTTTKSSSSSLLRYLSSSSAAASSKRPNLGEKRKRAALAAESRIMMSKMKQRKNNAEVIDLVEND